MTIKKSRFFKILDADLQKYAANDDTVLPFTISEQIIIV
jgi:hypothetical protein